MKYFFLLIGLLLTFNTAKAQQIDVQHYDLSLTVRNLSQKTIYGKTLIRYDLKQSADSLFLELHNLQIDSVIRAGQNLAFTQRSDSVWIYFSQTITPRIDSLEVFYHGTPGQDPQGFGGFLFQDSTYAYNIGVSLNYVPHNFGKAWFPCRDNFTDKATFKTHIHVDKGYQAACGGVLYHVDTLPDSSLIFHWNMNTLTPTYLASVAVAKYAVVQDTVQGMNGVIPIQLFALPNDTNSLKLSFASLKTIFHLFENLFGPYQFQRVGYVLVPFQAGAMEHASNIAYPRILANGSSAFAYLIAHELSHHWFGDLVTCDKHEEMWLNEGWATYCEALFYEFTQNKDAYKNHIRSLHEDVLRRGHILDEGYYPLNQVPGEHTYGNTVYKKGATIVHTLRNYLGDSLFFLAAKSYLTQHQWGNASSDTLLNAFQQATNQNLTTFFQGFVFTEGFTHFALDTFYTAPQGSNFLTTFTIRQSLKQKPNYVQTRLPIAFLSQNLTRYDTVVQVNAMLNNYQVVLPFEPALILIDPEETVADATTDEYRTLTTISTLSFDKEYAVLTVSKLQPGASAFVRVVHNYIDPQGNQPQNGIYVFKRYWDVQIIKPDTFEAKCSFRYNGGTTGTTGYLDTEAWTVSTEDSLVLLYRPTAKDPWQVWDSVIHQKGNATDKVGLFEARALKAGQYAVGYKDTVQAVSNTPEESFFLNIYPNPAYDRLHIDTNLPVQHIVLQDLFGRTLMSQPFEPSLILPSLPKGLYILQCVTSKRTYPYKIVIDAP